MGLTDDETAELAVLERELFAGSVAASDAQIARYELLRTKKLGGSADEGIVDAADIAHGDTGSNDTVAHHSDRAVDGSHSEEHVGAERRAPKWLRNVRAFPVLKKLGYAGIGLGVVALIAGLSIAIPALAPKVQPVATGALTPISMSDLPEFVNRLDAEQSHAMIAMDVVGMDFYVVNTEKGTCATVVSGGFFVPMDCESYSNVMTVEKTSLGGVASMLPDFPNHLIITSDKVTFWDELPRDIEEYR